ncbi:hypothetical protein B9Z55_011776 [Caenorhabditis nigoni]|uniref:SUN domain-containing protein n=1 Tax=Caenorhabditis nigoni TaxID=1611254 RepID=A0A2G5UM75_9PELO|nr:hypothetical protein B9Z55_011776 [Caenorhabditis nigoni]
MKSQINALESAIVSGKPIEDTKPLEKSMAEVSIPKGPFRFNAADYLHGASVDIAHSSSSNLNTFFGLDQTNLVLLDRPQPPKDKAWCSNENSPVLTINLSKFIKPVYVSYQHAKWHEQIPNEAPKIYDVVACLDFHCNNWKPLASNCEYSTQSIGTEQFCNITSPVTPIEKVQFRFRENYGDSKMTCVHLVRVYEETQTPVITEKKKDCEKEKICRELKKFYHNSSLDYAVKNTTCSFLYENDCCSDCPECCEECMITEYDTKPIFIFLGTLYVLAFFLFLSPFAPFRPSFLPC